MKYIFLINSLITFLIFSLTFINFFRHYDKKYIKKVSEGLFFLGIIYLVISLFSILWFFNSLNYSSKDFLFIYTFLIILQCLLLYRIIRLYSKNKNLSYLLFFYFLTLLTFFSPRLDFFLPYFNNFFFINFSSFYICL